MPAGHPDDQPLAAALRDRGAVAEFLVWDEPAVDCGSYDLVVVRSTWDYTRRRERFLEWADSVGERLRNSPATVRWNSDKRYLADLAAAGLPVPRTRFVA